MFAMSTFRVAGSTVNRLKWSEENDWLCNTNKHKEKMGASSLHWTSIQMACNMLVFSSHVVGIDWPLFLCMQCVLSSQCLHRKREWKREKKIQKQRASERENVCEYDVVEMIKKSFILSEHITFLLSRCGMLTLGSKSFLYEKDVE